MERFSHWRRRNGLLEPDVGNEEKEEKVEKWVMSISRVNSEKQGAVEYPDEVRFNKAKTVWEHKDSSYALDEVISDRDLKEIAVLTDCVCNKHQNQQAIFIGADSEEKLQSAVRKLDHVKEHMVNSTHSTCLWYW